MIAPTSLRRARGGPLHAILAAGCIGASLAGCVNGRAPTPAPLRPVQSSPVASPVLRAAGCQEPGWAAQPARANAASIDTLPWGGFGRPETGWAIYAPAIAIEVASVCPPGSAGFAGDVLRWQTMQGLAATGAVDTDTLDRMRRLWQGRRPFVALRAAGICPDPPSPAALDTAAPTEGLGTKPIQLRRRVLAAYRAMVVTARAETPAIAADPSLLTLFSGYRDATSDAARCARENNCQGVVRAACSAHRTGLALDIHVGAAAGHAVDSSSDVNRLAQVRGPAYRWLIANARRFGFTPYAFEPWHWEWTGEPP